MPKILLIMGLLSWLTGCASQHDTIAGDKMTYFSLRKGDSMARFSGYGYEVKLTEEGKVHFLFDEGYPFEKEFTVDDTSVFDTLNQLVLKHKMYKYSGHYKPPVFVTDGASWDLYVKYASKNNISAGGYMAGPSGYKDAFNEIREYLDKWKATPVETNDLTFFRYNYGKDHIVVQREEDHALVTWTNDVTGTEEVYEKDLEMMVKLRELLLIYRLRENRKSTIDSPTAILWSFEAQFKEGDHYLYEAYDNGFRCGYTEAFHGFFRHWLNIEFEKPKRSDN